MFVTLRQKNGDFASHRTGAGGAVFSRPIIGFRTVSDIAERRRSTRDRLPGTPGSLCFLRRTWLLGGDEDALVMEDEAEMNLRTGARERCRAASGCAPTPGVPRFLLLATAALAALGAGASAGRTENLTGALVKAYVNNPTINSSRAAVRAADENVRLRTRVTFRLSPRPAPSASSAPT